MLQICSKTFSYAAWKKKEKNKTENCLKVEINLRVRVRFLPAIISYTQKGFLKNRSIAENTRLIYDLIDKLNSSN